MTRLRQLRKSKKISMKKFGELFDLSESAICLYETGKRHPNNDTLTRIADYFGVSVDYLLGREQAPISDDYILLEKKRLLISRISELTKEEIEEVSNYTNYLLSKRQS